MKVTDLTISIVNWNGKEYIIDFLKSIFQHTKDISFEIIVVDNGSRDDSIKEIQKKFPQVIIIKNQENIGYARAHNQAFKRSHGRYIVFLNLDMLLIEDSFSVLVDYMDQHPKIDICTPTLLYEDYTIQPNIKKNPQLLSQILILLKIHVLFRHCSPMRQYLAQDFDYTKEQEVEQIMGACVFARRSIMNQVNGWSNEYPFWFEDLDLCKKVQLAQGKIMYIPKTKIIHFESKSAQKQLSLEKQKKFNRGLLLYFFKYQKFYEYIILYLLHPISLFLAWLVQLFKFKSRSQSKISK